MNVLFAESSRVPTSLPINSVKPSNGSPARSPLPSPVKMTSAPATPDRDAMLKPKKTGSIALFFRKVGVLEFLLTILFTLGCL